MLKTLIKYCHINFFVVKRKNYLTLDKALVKVISK
jgi:hypothetical protein